MSGVVVELEASEHQKVEKLLPWLLVDGLDEAELELVRAHLKQCQLCEADLAWQREVLQAGAPPCLGAPDVERAFGAMGWSPGRAASPRTRNWRWPKRRAPGLAAMLAIQSAAMGLFVLALGHGSGDAADGNGNVRISFRASTTEPELRRILLGNRARIVDGPTAGGAYVLQVPVVEACLSAMRQEEAVVRAEALEDEAEP